MNDQWLDRKALITVKAYPNPSKKYQETVCVAAITREEGWVRLYPINFRSLSENQSFKKYQFIQLRMQRHTNDPRPESFRPDESSIQLLNVLGTENKWRKRREWIEPTLSNSMCEIQRDRISYNKSIGAFRPKKVVDLIIEETTTDWSGKQSAALDQLMLFEKKNPKLQKIPFNFRFKYFCNDDGCKGHNQSILDWEIRELYRKIQIKTSDPDQIKTKIRAKYLDEICGKAKDTYFFVGNHSQYPKTFMLLGVFWPPSEKQKTLF